MSEANDPKLSLEDINFSHSIIKQMESNMGIQLLDLFNSNNEIHQIRTEIHERIIGYVQNKIDKEEPSDEWPLAGVQRDARKALGLEGSINVVPNISLLQRNYIICKDYKGDQLKDFVKRISNGLSLIQDGQTPGQVAVQIVGSGLAAFAIAMIIGTIKAMRAGAVFRTALVTGVKAMGSVSVVVGVAALIIAEILLYLMLNNKKQFLGLMFNNTDLNLVVDDWRSGTGGSNKGDLFLNTGSMNSFMEQHENEYLDSPLIQIGARMIVEPDDPNSDDNMILGGLYFAEKNFGLYGTEGAMVLHDRKKDFPRFGLLFACPYTMDNGVNVTIDSTKRSAKQVFESLYGSRGLDKKISNNGYIFTAKANSTSGGEAMSIATLDKI